MAATAIEMTANSEPAAHNFEPTSSQPTSTAWPRVLRQRRALLLGALLLALITAITIGVLQLKQYQDNSRGAALRASAVQVATQVVTHLTSVTSKTVTADMNRLLGETAGAFRDQFTQQEKLYSKLLNDSQVSSTGAVVQAGVESIQPGKATVLIAAVAEVRNNAATDGQHRVYRMRVSLERDGDRWLASNMELVP
ncbi:MAG: Mce-associated rane protein [Pseudonocardiales bacterium]|jgi:Mce-associated membrane protein|nr:Mce-associated rane protein [Pseudonocardiales bacterium]MDT7697602.1 Mce-associated rane protein [Pseudonocardiales bacterium]